MFDRLQATWRQYAALDRRVWIMAGVRAINTMGLSLAMAFMAIYLVETRGATAKLYGLIYLVANLFQSLSQGYAGELSDKLGRRRIMVAALLVRVFVMAGLGTQVLYGAPILAIAATLVVSGTLRGMFEPVAYALVADVAQPGQRVAAYGLQRMGTNLGWAVGPAMGGILSIWIPYGTVFYIAGGFLVLAALATARVDDPGHLADADPDAVKVSLVDAFRQSLGRADLTLLLVCSFLFAVVHVQLFTTLSIFGAGELDMTNADIGLVYGVNGIAVLLLQIPAVGYIDRAGSGRALVFGSLLYTVSFIAVGLATGTPTVAAAILILTIGEVIVAPAHQAIAADIADEKRMGRAFGLIGLMQMLGVAVAPLAGGALYDALRGEPLVLWGCLAVLPVLLAVGYRVLDSTAQTIKQNARLSG